MAANLNANSCYKLVFILLLLNIVGLSPARTFSAAITLRELFTPTTIWLVTFEWAILIELFKRKNNFFEYLPIYPNKYDSVVFPGGDFCTITQEAITRF